MGAFHVGQHVTTPRGPGRITGIVGSPDGAGDAIVIRVPGHGPISCRPDEVAPRPIPEIPPGSRISVRILPWQAQGLQYTASGYGRAIPTRYVLQRAGETVWRRVYCTIYSNRGTCWIRILGEDFAEVVPDYRVSGHVPAWPASVPVWRSARECE